MRTKFFLLMCLLLVLFASVVFAAENGVYLKVVEKARGSFDEVSSKIESALKNAGWEVLATYNSGVPEGCKFRSRVIVFTSHSYAQSILSHGIKAAFALPLKAGIYEDETGVNVAVVNPASINRTFINETKLDDLSVSTVNAVADVISRDIPGNVIKKQIGEIRGKGKVGGMEGGDFLDKIEEVYAAPDDTSATLKKVSENVKSGILGNKKTGN